MSKTTPDFDTFVGTLVRSFECSGGRSSPSPPPCMSLSELSIRLIQTLDMVALKEPNHSKVEQYLYACALDL